MRNRQSILAHIVPLANIVAALALYLEPRPLKCTPEATQISPSWLGSFWISFKLLLIYEGCPSKSWTFTIKRDCV